MNEGDLERFLGIVAPHPEFRLVLQDFSDLKLLDNAIKVLQSEILGLNRLHRGAGDFEIKRLVGDEHDQDRKKDRLRILVRTRLSLTVKIHKFVLLNKLLDLIILL